MKIIDFIFKWLLRNLSNFYGLVGILLTLYFGFYYVPDWVEETKHEKILAAKLDIQQNIKELVFSDSTVTIIEIGNLYHAKEIELETSFPFDITQILTLTQESFMEDKFLPLSKRRELNNEIEVIKKGFIKSSKNNSSKSVIKESNVSVYQIISIAITALAAIFGVVSFYLNFKNEEDKQAEINNELERSKLEVKDSFSILNVERKYIDVFRNLPKVNDIYVPNYDEGYDMSFMYENKRHYVEFKFLSQSKVGLGSFKNFLNSIKQKTGEGWLIYNTDLTPLAIKEAKEYNESNKGIYLRLIKVTNEKELVEKVKDLLKD